MGQLAQPPPRREKRNCSQVRSDYEAESQIKTKTKSCAQSKSKAKEKQVATREELALGILMRVCQKLGGGSKGHKKKTKGKGKAKGGGTKGQKTAAKKLKKLSKHYGKLKYDANPELAF